MPQYRKKPVEIEARLYDPDARDAHEVVAWCGAHRDKYGKLVVATLEGDMEITPGDYVIKGVEDEFYPCKPRIFEKTYDAVVSDPTGDLVKMNEDRFALEVAEAYKLESELMGTEGADVAIKVAARVAANYGLVEQTRGGITYAPVDNPETTEF